VWKAAEAASGQPVAIKVNRANCCHPRHSLLQLILGCAIIVCYCESEPRSSKYLKQETQRLEAEGRA
jgi:hypothetical protein